MSVRLRKQYFILITILLVSCLGTSNVTSIPEKLIPTQTKREIATQPPSCRSIAIAPTPGSEESSIFPDISEDDHIQGPNNADITIIEYGDFQCPSCAELASIMTQLEVSYPADFRFVFRQLPLFDIHDKALIAAEASEAANSDGKFWEMYHLLFEERNNWGDLTPEDFSKWVIDQSPRIGLDQVQFSEELSNQTIKDHVQNDLKQGLSVGLRTTPFLLINGQIYNGPQDYESFDLIIKMILLGKKQFINCPEMSIDPIKQYIATIQTEKGDIMIQLYADKAPVTVNSFVFLARGGWYDNITFHRVISGYVAQTGDPSGTGMGGPGYLFEDEIVDNLKFDKPGVVGMANSGKDTNGSQFFITYDAQPDLDGQVTIFGQVIKGIEILSLLTPRNPGIEQNLPTGDKLISIRISEK